MGYQVTIQPSGHSFHAEPQESLLEAALRSGININYNCSSGSCGDCKARVVVGMSEDKLFHDYRLSESERSNGIILLCTSHAASDLVIEAQEAHGAGDIPRQQITTKVTKVERLNDAIMTMVLRTPRSQTLRFLAGQHVELHSGGHTIDLPISSCPCNGMMLQFHMRLGRDEPFASHILAQGHSNTTVMVDGPFGEFVLDDDSLRPLVMIAEDTGFAPIKGLVEHAINLEKTQPIHLYRIASDVDGLYMGNYCESWRVALDDFSYTALLLASHNEQLQALARIIDATPQPQQSDFYLAISQPLVEEAERQLLVAGIPAGQIYFHQRRTHPRSLATVALS